MANVFILPIPRKWQSFYFEKCVFCFVALVGKSAADYHRAICECSLRLLMLFFQGRHFSN
jgi:hypothetical protein